MLERFTPQPITPERKRYDYAFYQDIAVEYRLLEDEVSCNALAIIALSDMQREGNTDPVIAFEKHRLQLVISDRQTQMKRMKETLGFEIGDRDGTRITGSIEGYNPFEHNLTLDPQEPDLLTGEPIIVRHSEISAVLHGERRVLLHAVYDRVTSPALSQQQEE